jgi:arylsulfatase
MNVIFCSLDTLRADRLTALGGTRGLTPNLDRLAGEGTLFTEAFATDIPTQPSHTALFTGRYGVNTGIISHFHPHSRLDEAVPWLPSLLRASGYRTGAVDHLFAMKDWFIRGYDDYMPPPGRSRSPGEEINKIAFPWIAEHRDRSFFLLLHYWDAHVPYVPPSPFREHYTSTSRTRFDPLVEQQLRSRPSYPLAWRNLYNHIGPIPSLEYISDLYDAEVAYLDYEIGRLFAHLEALGILGDTMVVLFGDHGENMTEHDAWFDHAGLYDSVVHVPLILWAPGRVPATEISAMVALLDVMPTVLDLVGLPAVDGLDGSSLLPLLTGERGAHRDSVVLSECTWQAKRALRNGKWKLIRSYHPGVYPRAATELYDLDADPTEQHDVSDDRPDMVKRLGMELDQWLARQLGGRPDPMFEVLAEGLPAVKRLDRIIASGHDGAAPADRADRMFVSRSVHTVGAPAVKEPRERHAVHRRRRGKHAGRRGFLRATLVMVAVVLAFSSLGFAVDALLLASPVEAAGVVEAQSVAQLNFGAAGTIAQIDVQPGHRVQAGAVLATEASSALTVALASDQAKLASDQAALQQTLQPIRPPQSQQLQDQVDQAKSALAAAQVKLRDVINTENADVASAQTQVQAASNTLLADQQSASADAATCASAPVNGPSSQVAACQAQARQVTVDWGVLSTAQAAYQQAVATRQADIDDASSAVSEARTALATAQAGQAVGLQPGTTASVSDDRATIAKDQATIAKDQAALSQTVLRAPFTGMVGSVNGVAGEVASPDGVRAPALPAALPQPPSSGISIFPQAPQQQTQNQAGLLPVITVDSIQSKIVIQVDESDIDAIHPGQHAQVSLPAFPGATFAAEVRDVEPSAVYVSGRPYYLVDLVLSSNRHPTDPSADGAAERLASFVSHPPRGATGRLGYTPGNGSRSPTTPRSPALGDLSGLSADVSF